MRLKAPVLSFKSEFHEKKSELHVRSLKYEIQGSKSEIKVWITLKKIWNMRLKAPILSFKSEFWDLKSKFWEKISLILFHIPQTHSQSNQTLIQLISSKHSCGVKTNRRR